MRPVAFDGTAGWLHEANGSRGVVIAGSHGFEDLCSRRFLTLLAARIAADGSPVLQFDYPGCGDATGDHTDPGQVAAWIGSIGEAIDKLRAETGVADVALIGFRLGALLSAVAARSRDDVAALALLAPPNSGKAFARELLGLSRMIDAALPPAPEAEPFDGLQAAGFRMSQATLDGLRALDPFGASLTGPVAKQLLVLGRCEPAAGERLAAALGVDSASATVSTFAGYDRLMCDPTANAIPEAVIEQCAEWVRYAGGGTRDAAQASEGVPLLVGPDYEEEPVVIGPAPQMCGVLCRPRGMPQAQTAVIFLNAGAVPHTGWARGTVEEARALAADGIASLRLDLPGLGQSGGAGKTGRFLYDVGIREDVIRAIDWMEGRGFAAVSLAGTCSGAFQAFHTARVDSRVTALAMVNPLCFRWNSSYALDIAVWQAYENSKIAFGQSKSNASHEECEAGRFAGLHASVSWLARRSIRRGIELAKSALSRLSPADFIRGNAVERWMRQLSARGIKILVVNCEGDLSLEEVDRHFGPDAERLRPMPGVSMLRIPAADHTMTPVHARKALVDGIAVLCGRKVRPARALRRRRKTSARRRVKPAPFQEPAPAAPAGQRETV